MGALDVQTDDLTWRDLDERFPELDRRELHDGVLVVSPSPVVGHQRVVTRLCRVLGEWADEHGGEVLVGPVDVVAAEQRVYQPDLLLVTAEHLEWFGGKKVHERPDLVVEVSSPSNRWFDLGAKRDAYAAFGVPEYWFVDLKTRAVLVHRLEGWRYPGSTTVGEGRMLDSPLLPGLALPVELLLG
ncbi:MAG: Uma2 family endonuclease [Egibacteraceae bacterium]